MNALLFLDFDGVVHPRTRGTFELLPMLEDWLVLNTHVDVVISSTWRLEYSLAHLREGFLCPELHPRIIDVTPDLPAHAGPVRQAEIEHWIAAHGRRTSRRAALDDDATLFQKGCPWLVQTEYTAGLTPQHLAALSRLIGDPRPL
ncbi:HAD domain-containing protein [Burkholderia cenocepacia]|uniref:HAD domain-containing protein n=1 Tax=Burkholderia cenocepacia TaxID=95486 RepID=UPI00076D7B8A|nr:HAD domain-containing protein [Burkholderia cenocepacia]KWU24765.1 hypothetical protein AS149_31975 [Burkholderia cenocepacia]